MTAPLSTPGQPLEPWPNLRARARTFFNAPLCEDVDQLNADVAFIGVPFDQGTLGRPGARFGPDALRDRGRPLRAPGIGRGVLRHRRRGRAAAGSWPTAASHRPVGGGGAHHPTGRGPGCVARRGAPRGFFDIVHFDHDVRALYTHELDAAESWSLSGTSPQ